MAAHRQVYDMIRQVWPDAMVWSLTDNFEWGGYAPRFGLYTVDVLKDPTLKRTPTAAVPPYREIIRSGGVGPDYRPVMAQ